MKCKNCGIEIDVKFKHSLTNNQCPACGKDIMDKIDLDTFLTAKQILDNMKVIGAEEIILSLMSVFEFHTKKGSLGVVGIVEKTQEPLVEKEKPSKQEVNVVASEKNIESIDISQKQTDPQLEKMRLDHLRKLQTSMLDNNSDIDVEENTEDPPEKAIVEEYIRTKQQNSTQKIQSGSGGAFRRSG